ncbi:MAG TPA: ribose 5-phosphate isomerase B [Alphaproteobacteria bacterium]|nr:ribose 5-phosphate isomerase B [Alphaproteobacteria bacterium]
MKIAIASDHGGFELKNKLVDYFKQEGLNIDDLGTYSADSVDYPDYADKMAEYILSKKAELGVLICGTGVGISIAANRHKGIRAALLYNQFVAEMAKKHNNANVIVFGGRTMSFDEVVSYIKIFLNTSFEGGRHQKRLDKLDKE